MSTIVTRAGKGAPLTHDEMDANLTNLNTDKLEKATINSVNGILKGDGLGGYTAAVAGTDFATAAEGDLAATALQPAAIGVTVQGYDVDTAKLDVDQTWQGAQRGAVTADNDYTFDLAAGNNFSCTPGGSGTLTFTNIAAGQSGTIIFTNNAAYTVSKAATVKCSATFLATVSATGLYRIGYYCDGTNVHVATDGAQV